MSEQAADTTTTTTASSAASAAVTVLGLGRMGGPIAAALLGAGRVTTVWNRSPERAVPLLKQGARTAATVADAVAASELVLVSLLDQRAVRDTLAAAAAHLRGRVVVNLTNNTPEEARELAAWVQERGARYLDGAMMALPETVATPEAFFLYSGSPEAFAEHRESLELLATAHFLGADPGLAEFEDLALLGSGYAALAGFLHSAALLASVGRPAAEFVPLVTRWLSGLLDFLPELAREVDARSYDDAASTVGMNHTALTTLVDTARSQGVDTALHEPLRELLGRRLAEGRGADSFSSVFELLGRQGGSGGSVGSGGSGGSVGSDRGAG
ncbi:NAD(P)-dependent oxidoreductase [Streptomyces monticola]|uniref:NAD(P)-dependent oxidoreductase n=1 Tax=Streptomyces monticola TaxID=2666263 RepID=A0ABW2JBM6_9ACTN